MTRILSFLAFFVLLSVLTADGQEPVAERINDKETGTQRSAVPGHEPMFSADVDLYLGQKSRRRSGGGRVWSNLYYGDTTLKPAEGGKIDPNFYGFQLGFDVSKSHGIFSTFFVNINQSKTKFSDGKLDHGSSTIDNYLLGYGKFFYLKMCHFTFAYSLGYDRYAISAGGEKGMGDGLQSNLFGEFGLDFILGKWTIKPFYALQYDFLYHGDIGRSPVLVKDWNGHGVTQQFGLRLNWRVIEMLEFQSRMVWIHEMLDNPPPFYHARFSPVHGTNTPAIMFYEGNTGRDWAWLGIGGKLEAIYNIYLFCDYDILFNERHVTHLASIGLCLGW